MIPRILRLMRLVADRAICVAPSPAAADAIVTRLRTHVRHIEHALALPVDHTSLVLDDGDCVTLLRELHRQLEHACAGVQGEAARTLVRELVGRVGGEIDALERMLANQQQQTEA